MAIAFRPIWARANGHEDSPLPAWLFGAEAAGDAIDSLTDERLSQALAERDVVSGTLVVSKVGGKEATSKAIGHEIGGESQPNATAATPIRRLEPAAVLAQHRV